MKVVFFGTPEFALPTLRALVVSRHPVLAVVTQPDRPVGRGRTHAASPVKREALARGLAVHEPVRLRGPLVDDLRALAPDALVVVAYGRILPPELLALPRQGAVNVHASLLPRHRGASPVHAAVLAGDRETGVTTMLMDEGLDTGAVLLVERTPIAPEEDSQALGARLAEMGARLLVETLDRLEGGDLEARPQPAEGATYAPKLRPQDADADWSLPAEVLARRVRGLQPWPGVAARLPDGRRLVLLRVQAVSAGTEGTPGTVVASSPEGIDVACGEGRLRLLEVKPEGKRAMPAVALVHGRQLAVGTRLGP